MPIKKLVPIAYAKRTLKILRQILGYPVFLEARNLQLEQMELSVFWHNFQVPRVFPDRDFLGYFPCAVGTLIVGWPLTY